MPYNTKNVLSSERPYQVLRVIRLYGGESYSSQVAEELDIDQSLASEIISRLKDVGILEEGDRKKAQYYEISRDGIFDLYNRLWEENLPEEEDMTEEVLVEMWGEEWFDDLPENVSVPQSDLRDLVLDFLDYYLVTHSESTIEKMLIEDFLEGLKFHIAIEGEEVEDWLKAHLREISTKANLEWSPGHIFNWAVEEQSGGAFRQIRNS